MVYKFFDKKTGSDVNVNEVPPQESHEARKPVIKKLKVYEV